MGETPPQSGLSHGRTRVKKIGWAWIAIGALLWLHGIIPLVFMAVASGPPGWSAGLFAFSAGTSAAYFVVGAVALLAAASLLEHEAWARPVLEALSWICGLVCAASTVWEIVQWGSSAVSGQAAGFSPPSLFRLLTGAAWSAVLFVSALSLRRDDVRAVLKSGDAAR